MLDPQTLAHALSDSPVGLLAWLLEQWVAWGDGQGDSERVFTREHMITGITFLGGENPAGISTDRRGDAFLAGPRSAFFNTVYLEAHERGGHFGYYENPGAVVDDLRAMLRPRRSAGSGRE